MSDKGKVVSQVVLFSNKRGLTGLAPIVLSDSGNLVIHLAPYPIVARLATVISKEDFTHAYNIMERELRVARHLQAKGIPVIPPTNLTDAGPFEVDGVWMTFWNYVSPTQLEFPTPSESVELVNALSMAMKDFVDELPMFGVWERACRSAERLKKQTDSRIHALLKVFLKVDEQMRIKPSLLLPCHGDAHARNLFPSPEGWLWTDFEDVSLMPAYWDLASFVGNLALFGGFQQPVFRYILDQADIAAERKAFGFALTARILMSTLGNLDLALEGHGDLEFANRQIELAEGFIRQVDLISGEK
jgi:hypothetical protein